jgi:hypothetical protein
MTLIIFGYEWPCELWSCFISHNKPTNAHIYFVSLCPCYMLQPYTALNGSSYAYLPVDGPVRPEKFPSYRGVPKVERGVVNRLTPPP